MMALVLAIAETIFTRSRYPFLTADDRRGDVTRLTLTRQFDRERDARSSIQRKISACVKRLTPVQDKKA